MNKILYFGNKLSSKGKNISYIELLSANLEKENFKVYSYSDKENIFLRYIEMVIQFLLKCNKVNIVLIDTYSTLNFWYAITISQLARIFKIKYIPILHGGNLPNRLKKNPFLSNIIFKHAFYNIAPSDYLFEAFHTHGFKNTICIENAIIKENYPFKERQKINPNLLWVRAIDSIYNPKMAIEVLSLLKNDFPDARLTMVGPEKDTKISALQEFAFQKKVDVTFTGKLSKQEWINIAEAHDIFINTTHFDNTPVSIIEAMCLGLPIVSTNVGGIPKLISNNENGLLVNDNDALEMVNQIKKLLINPTLGKELAQKALIKTATFDWSVVKQKWLEVLK